MAKHWTLADMSSQAGRRAIVTGASNGIGYSTALELARKGAHVLLACRDHQRGSAALQRLRQTVPRASAELVLLDLASLESVRGFAEKELAEDQPLDLLINNAGVMAPKKRVQTKDGFELQFATNVLGHFALTARLLPALERAARRCLTASRVVTIASIAHKRGQLNFDDLQSGKAYNPMGAYRQSKLADLMFAFELDRRLCAAGPPYSKIMSLAAHPGVANTNLFQTGEYSEVERFVRRGFGVAIGALLNSQDEGALATLYAATAPEAQRGAYYGPQGYKEMRGQQIGSAQIAPQALDGDAAKQLWRECERLTATRIGLPENF